jgi:molybdenum cofactor cytidylyltransferase
MRPVVAAILAAGASRRLGRPKQLLPFDGGTLLGRIAARVCEASCARVAVVLGAGADEIAPALDALPVEILHNEAWSEGIAASIRRAVEWARAIDSAALVLCLGDQPRLTAAHIDALAAAYRGAGSAVASRYAGGLGVPALFDARWYSELAALRGDRGARGVLAAAQAIAIDWPDGVVDVDEPEHVAQLDAL